MEQTIKPASQKDNLLGICHAVGDAFGFDPIFLRLAFVLGMLASAQYAILSYVALGLAVLAAALVNRLARRPARPQAEILPLPARADPQPELLAA